MTDHTDQVVADLARADAGLSQDGQRAAEMLASVGLTSTANSVLKVCGRGSQAASNGVKVCIDSQNVLDALKYVPELIQSLEEEVAPPLSAAGSAISELGGLEPSNWTGTGADAYSRYSDKQSKAATELSASAIQLASLIRDNLNTAKAHGRAAESAAVEFALETIASAIALIPPATPAGVAGIVAAIVRLCVQMSTIDAENKEKIEKLRSDLSKLKSMGPNPGTSVFTSGKWPDKKLY